MGKEIKSNLEDKIQEAAANALEQAVQHVNKFKRDMILSDICYIESLSRLIIRLENTSHNREKVLELQNGLADEMLCLSQKSGNYSTGQELQAIIVLIDRLSAKFFS